MSRDRGRPANTIRGMGRVGRTVAGCLVLAALVACRERASEPDGGSPAGGEAAVSERERWRARLHWSDDCEEAFRATHTGSTGGVTVVPLQSGGSLVEVDCAAGSYQPSAVRFKLSDGNGETGGRLLSFPVYTSSDGVELTLSRDTEVWGESAVNATAGEIVILSLARQTADCGIWTRYSLRDDDPRLLEAAALTRCPATPGTPVRLSAAAPPDGWAVIPRKD